RRQKLLSATGLYPPAGQARLTDPTLSTSPQNRQGHSPLPPSFNSPLNLPPSPPPRRAIQQVSRDRLHDFAELGGAVSAQERFLDGGIIDELDFEETLRHFLEMRLTQ